jgi:RNA polymerase sigma-70 factor (ECF subfamily)
LCVRGRSAHAAFAIDDSVFVAHLARCGASLDDEPEAVHAEDLYLACACLAWDAGAITHLRALPHPKTAVRRFGQDASFLDEVELRLWDGLLLGAAAGPGLATYAGAGPLDRWVSVCALRVAVTILRRRAVAAHARDEMAAQALLVPRDAEIEAMKQRYREPFERALAAAITGLNDRDKTVLRMSLVDGATLQRIGQVYGVHHTTVLRWLDAARARILAETKRRVHAELNVETDEFDSLVGLVVSQLNLNVRRELGGPSRLE